MSPFPRTLRAAITLAMFAALASAAPAPGAPGDAGAKPPASGSAPKAAPLPEAKPAAPKATTAKPAAAKPKAAGAKPPAAAGRRTLGDVHIEGEVPVPQVLFVTARDQRRVLDFGHARYLRTSRQLAASTPLPGRLVIPSTAAPGVPPAAPAPATPTATPEKP